MRSFCVFLLACLFLMGSELYFLPLQKEEAKRALVDSLLSAKKSIDVAMFSFTSKDLAKTLKKAAEKGIRVRVVFDREWNLKNDHSRLGYLAKYKNVECYLLEGEASDNKKWTGKMHIKMAIVDDVDLVLGSANWSFSAFNKNHETLLILEDKKMISQAKTHFENLVKASQKYD